MAKGPEIAMGLSIFASWAKTIGLRLAPEIDNTLCRLKITIGGEAATSYKMDNGQAGDSVEVPAYFIAEWIARNWWPLFYEPQKSEVDDAGFRSRHWLGTARNGFALPDMWLVPSGDEITTEAIATRIDRCRVNFTANIERRLSIPSVMEGAEKFIRTVVERLNAAGLTTTDLHDAWGLVSATEPDERSYCELIGAIGLCPYEDRPEIDKEIDLAEERLGLKVVRQLCEASRPDTFLSLSAVVRDAFEKLSTSEALDFSPLPERPLAPTRPAWELGKRAAFLVRQKLGIIANAEAGETAFRRLGIKYEAAGSLRANDEDVDVQGAVDRRQSRVRMALVRRRDSASLRFAVARAIYLGWGTEDNGASLMTNAHTREQQASRAFGAELLAPIEFIKSAAGRGPVSTFRVKAIADELGVSPQMVTYQAVNNRIPLTL